MSRIKNIKGLIENAESAGDKFAREIALTLLERVLTEADPKVAMQRVLQLNEGKLKIQGQVFVLEAYDKIYVIGGGKAGGGMAESVENLLGERISGGWINIPTGTKKRYKTKIIVLNESTHPVPNEAGVKGSKRILEIAQGAGEKDLVIVLLSGGASALIPYPTEGLSLSDMQDITGGLLRSGADIVEVNSVRKHLSKVKGGRLAQACYPATVVSLIISDVVCDPLDVIASGPTAPDPTTYTDALSVLEKYRLTKDYPRITDYLKNGGRNMHPETLKKGDLCIRRTHNFLISTNSQVLNTVADEFKDRYDIQIFSTTLSGEVREVGRTLARRLMDAAAAHQKSGRSKVLIAGGETTVTVTGDGRGGRNQELVLSAMTEIDGEGICIASMGTDGIDGATDAAGAIADGKSKSRAQAKNLSPQVFLSRNDSYHVFKELDDLIMTGPTGTNVNDVVVLVIN